LNINIEIVPEMQKKGSKWFNRRQNHFSSVFSRQQHRTGNCVLWLEVWL